MNILLMGDAGISSEEEIMRTYNLERMDILKVGHHGSVTSSSKKFLDIIEQSLALISVGLNNRFNHPHPKVIDRLNQKVSSIYKTSVNGSVRIVLNPEIEVYTCY
ncbi:MAG: hypothetical protein PHO63_02525 [Bacilli bacterium]|nr:hypothetical protein [Bacilli bacterium]